jgi:transcriptional regulator with XRE-family HTH domain
MAAHLGVSRNTITNWEKDDRRPKRHVVLVWAQVTGAPIEWLTEGSDFGPFGRVIPFDLRKQASAWKLNLRELPLAA